MQVNGGAGSGTSDNSYGINIQNGVTVAGAAFANQYGIVIANQTNGGTSNVNLALGGTPAAGNFNIYSASTNPSYFAGNIGIGATPNSALTVVGNVGIGVTAAGSNLSVSGNGVFGWCTTSVSGPANGLGIFGNVGIGTSTANYNLSVVGTANISGALTVGGSITPTGQFLAGNGTAGAPSYSFTSSPTVNA